jgi:hypothetical protein
MVRFRRDRSMDREGPDQIAPGQEAHEETAASQHAGDEPAGDSVAAGTSERVAGILAKAEQDAADVRENAEREAEAIAEAARGEGRGVMQAAHGAAQAAARERAERLAELRASIAARSGSLTEGLEGGELTRVRLDELVTILGEVEARIMREVEPPPPGAGSTGSVPAPATAPATPPPPPPAMQRRDGGLPDGAPMMRMPQRAGDREADARFTAVVMAIEGGQREQIADHLRTEYGENGWDALLDELFGRVDVKA